MFDKIIEAIEESNTIIIIRHKNPDYDAYGSQLGLYYSLIKKYPNKTIYKVGDDNKNNIFGCQMDEIDENIYKDALVIHIFGCQMDEIDENIYKDALVILVDQSSLNMLNDDNVLRCKKSIIMDHHENKPDFGDIVLIRSDYSSASELVSEFIIKTGLPLDDEVAKYLYVGICGDSNRFYYKGTSANTFFVATKLLETGIDIIDLYKKMEREEGINEKRFKGYILSNFIISDGIAYSVVPKEILMEYQVNEFYSARGTVNLLSGIKGIKAFCNFTEIPSTGEILTELRSKEKDVVSVAFKYGGGGHKLACGCTLKSRNQIELLLNDLKKEIN